MTELFYAVLKASFQGSIVILAVLALRLLLKKAPKSLFCLLWLLAGLRLVLPFEIHSSLSLQPRLDEADLSFRAEQPVQIPGQMGLDSQSPELPETQWENIQSVTVPYSEEAGVITEPVRYGDVAAQIWILGMAAMLAASAVSYFRLKRRVREAYRIEEGCFECPGLETAFVLGYFSPKIYLPKGLAEQEKRFIFDHENTHIARRDHWSKLLGYLVLAMHWFNPLVWLAYHLLCRDMELACDEHVVKYMTLPERKAYSAALLSCGSHATGLAACPVAFGESNPKKRILNVLNYKRPGFWITLLAVIAVIFVSVCLLTSPENREEAPPEEELLWNLEMKVTDVTPTGLTVEFVQQGPFKGYDRAELQYGSHYFLQRQENGQWADVEMLPQEYDVAWTMEAYIIKRDNTTRQKIAWEWLYGQLPTGHYRIGKTVTLFRNAGDADEQTLYAEFVVFEDSAWNMEMTGEEYLALCRSAVEAFQEQECCHISETLVYSINEKENARDYCTYWRAGENWLRDSQAAKLRENTDVLYYAGDLYLRRNAEANWTKADGGAGYDRVWLEMFNWDAQQIVFTHAEQVKDVLHVFVTVKATPPMLGWDDVDEYMLGFFFDTDGNLQSALMGCTRGKIGVMFDLRMNPTTAQSIRTKLEQTGEECLANSTACTDTECTDTTHGEDHHK